MFRWMPYAMVRVTLCLVGGILAAVYFPDCDIAIVSVSCFVAFLCFLITFFLRIKSLRGLFGLSVVLLSGYLLVRHRSAEAQTDHLVNLTTSYDYYQVVVSRYAEEREKSWRLEAEVNAIRTDRGWEGTRGRVLLYFPKLDFSNYQYGDVLIIKGVLRGVDPPWNPGEFDFRRFLAFKGIHFQDYVTPDRILVAGNAPSNRFLEMAIDLRVWSNTQLTHFVTGDRERATVSALVLGVTDGLDTELLQAYSATGALHVLAVSGLHVSIIYWILLILLKPLDRTGPLKWLLAFISVFVLWSYAFVSGWSPSVLRAVTMFSFVALARPWRQSTNIFNTLASSMFCLLLYDPFYIMSVGFQLSYLAVFGIVYLQPKIYRWWEPGSVVADEIWKVSSVSLAAQIATLPISLFYFHQFPNYFLFANLLVIPISFVVLVAGLAVIAFAWVGPVASILGFILTWTVKLMNFFVLFFEGMPLSVIDGIYIDLFQCLALAAGIGAVILLLAMKRFAFFWIMVVAAFSFSWRQWVHLTMDVMPASVHVYRVPGATVMDFVGQGNAVLYMDTLKSRRSVNLKFHIVPTYQRVGVDSKTVRPQRDFGNNPRGFDVWTWNGLTVLRLHDRDHRLRIARADLLVISNNAVQSLRELEYFSCKKIIVDSSNSLYLVDRIEEENKQLRLPVWSVLKEGAFTYAVR